MPDGAGQKKKKVSVFDEGTAAKLSAHLDLPKREKTSFKIYFNKKKNSFSQKIKLEPKNLTILTFMTFFDILDRDKKDCCLNHFLTFNRYHYFLVLLI